MASIEKRGQNSWRFVVEVGYSNKKRKKRYKTIRVEDKSLLKKPRKLQEYLEEQLLLFKMQVESGEYITPEQDMFLRDFVTMWEKRYGSKHLDEKTLETYQYVLEKDVLPVLGDLQLKSIKPLDIVEFLDHYEEQNTVSSSSVHTRYRILRDLLSRARDWKYIKENPVESITRPKQEYKEYGTYSEDEVVQITKALEKHAEKRKRVMILIALTGGLRRGELLALDEDDFQFASNQIRIDESLQYTKKYGYRFKAPKNKFSYRNVTIPENVMNEAKEIFRENKKLRLKLGELWEGDKDKLLLFSSETGRPWYPTSPNKWWRGFTKRNGIRQLRFHDLRHTHATLLINQIGKVPGLNIKSISRRLGHSNVQTTLNIYVHTSDENDLMASEAIENLVNLGPN